MRTQSVPVSRICVAVFASAVAAASLAACTSGKSRPSTAPASANSSASTTASGVPAASAARSVTVAFVDLPNPASLTFKVPTLEFGVTITNPTTTAYPHVAWVVATDPFAGGAGPRGEIGARFEQRDPTTGSWGEAALESTHDEHAWLEKDWPSVPLPPGGSIALRYRLTLVGVGGSGGTTQLRVFLVKTDDHTKLTEITTSIRVTQ